MRIQGELKLRGMSAQLLQLYMISAVADRSLDH